MADEFGLRSGEEGTADASLATPLLAPLAALGEQECGGGDHGSQPALHASYAQQYLRMAAWLGALFAGYAVQRACCQFGLPKDGLRQVRAAKDRKVSLPPCGPDGGLHCCQQAPASRRLLHRLDRRSFPSAQLLGRPHPARQINFLEFFTDATSTALWGAVLGWFVGITCPGRFRWLFSRWAGPAAGAAGAAGGCKHQRHRPVPARTAGACAIPALACRLVPGTASCPAGPGRLGPQAALVCVGHPAGHPAGVLGHQVCGGLG